MLKGNCFRYFFINIERKGLIFIKTIMFNIDSNKLSIDSRLVSLKIAQFWKYNVVERGLPETAKAVLMTLLENGGTNYKKSGFSQFDNGSFANGGVCLCLLYINALMYANVHILSFFI